MRPTRHLLLVATIAVALLACTALPSADAFSYMRFPSYHHHQPASVFHQPAAASWLRPHFHQQPYFQTHRPSLEHFDLLHQQQEWIAHAQQQHARQVAALEQQLAQQQRLLHQVLGVHQQQPKVAEPQQVTPPPAQEKITAPAAQPQAQHAPVAPAQPKAAEVPQKPRTKLVVVRNPDMSIEIKEVPIVDEQAKKAVEAPKQQQAPPVHQHQQPTCGCRGAPAQPPQPKPAPQQPPAPQAQPQQAPVRQAQPTPAPQQVQQPQPQRQQAPPRQEAPVTREQPRVQQQQQQQPKPAEPTPVVPPVAPTSTPVLADEVDDTPQLLVHETPDTFEISMAMSDSQSQIAPQYIHAEIRANHLVLTGERHYEDKLVLRAEEVGRIGQYGFVRRRWKMPKGANEVDIQNVEAIYDQSKQVLHVRLIKLTALGKNSALTLVDSTRTKAIGSTIFIPVRVVGEVPVRQPQIILPEPAYEDPEYADVQLPTSVIVEKQPQQRAAIVEEDAVKKLEVNNSAVGGGFSADNAINLKMATVTTPLSAA